MVTIQILVWALFHDNKRRHKRQKPSMGKEETNVRKGKLAKKGVITFPDGNHGG